MTLAFPAADAELGRGRIKLIADAVHAIRRRAILSGGPSRCRQHDDFDRPAREACAANGIDKIAVFVSLFGGNKPHVAVLLPFVKGQRANIDNLKQSKLLENSHILTVTEFVPQAEADIEDLRRLNYLSISSTALITRNSTPLMF